MLADGLRSLARIGIAIDQILQPVDDADLRLELLQAGGSERLAAIRQRPDEIADFEDDRMHLVKALLLDQLRQIAELEAHVVPRLRRLVESRVWFHNRRGHRLLGGDSEGRNRQRERQHQ